MGVFLEAVAARAQGAPALAHRAALFLSSQEKRAIVVEAADDQYYYAVLLRRHTHHRSVEFFVALGKGKVVSTLEVLRDLGKLDRSFGIRDRDFDYEIGDRLVDNHCLVLDVYSFENYLGEGATLIDAGKNAFGLETGSPELAGWIAAVGELLTTLPSVLALEHAQAYWCRSQGKTCHLNNFQVVQSINIDISGQVSRKPNTNADFLAQTSADLAEMTEDDCVAALTSLAQKGWTKAVRGHFFWQIFVRLLNDFRAVLDAEFQAQGRPRTRTRAMMSERHIMEAAIPFSHTRPMISSFFEEVVA